MTQDNKSWEEGFRQEFGDVNVNEVGDVKSFIHSTLNKEREKERNRLIEKVEGMRNNEKGDSLYKLGRNSMCSDILTILKEK